MDSLRSVDEIPDKFRSVFSTFRSFNKIQSTVFDEVFHTDNSIVASSPTGSGKTVLFELAIIRFLTNSQVSKNEDCNKIIYLCPLRALCEERLQDWTSKFQPLGVNCTSVTGDDEDFDLNNLSNYTVIITTPEKWDSLTRQWKKNQQIIKKIKLFMIDEVHLLNEDGRGSTLEVVLSRMKTIENTFRSDLQTTDCFQSIRFFAVSATIPNIGDVAEWLGNESSPAKCFCFGEDTRPVPLKKLVYGYSNYNNHFKFDMVLNYRLNSIIMNQSEGKPTLIFCSTRKSVEMTVKYLLQNMTISLNEMRKKAIGEACASISNVNIKEALQNGVGCHHAGLPKETRQIMENLFRHSCLGVLVTTSSLALGVNLPAHLVIIKTTKYYFGGELKDYGESMILQMIGRAGRPQYDQSGTAVILTSNADKKKIEKLLEGQQPIESNLHKHLSEHINAEVVLYTITDVVIAMQWIQSTFLRIRVRNNPTYYGFPPGLTSEQVDKKLLDLCQIEMNKLARIGLIIIDPNNVKINPTISGAVMAKYYISFETMKLFKEMTGDESLQEVLEAVTRCKEFSDIYLRTDEKKTLNFLNSNKNKTIRFRFKGKISSSVMKINCIIQAVFGCLPILNTSLSTESQKIMRNGERISKCLAEYLEQSDYQLSYAAFLNTLLLVKCFSTKLWEKSEYVSRQLPGIGTALSAQLVLAGKTSFQKILESNPRDLERIMNRKPPFGSNIHDKVKHLPSYDLVMGKEEIDDTIRISIDVKLTNAECLRSKSTINLNSIMYLIVGDPNTNRIYYFEKFCHLKYATRSHLEEPINVCLSKHVQSIKAHLISENWVGIDKEAVLFLKLPEYKKINEPIKSSKKKLVKATSRRRKFKLKSDPNQTLVHKYFGKCKKNFNLDYIKKVANDGKPGKNAAAIKDELTENNIVAENSSDIVTNTFPINEEEINNNDTLLSQNNQVNISPEESLMAQEQKQCDSVPTDIKLDLEAFLRENVENYDELCRIYANTIIKQEDNVANTDLLSNNSTDTFFDDFMSSITYDNVTSPLKVQYINKCEISPSNSSVEPKIYYTDEKFADFPPNISENSVDTNEIQEIQVVQGESNNDKPGVSAFTWNSLYSENASCSYSAVPPPQNISFFNNEVTSRNISQEKFGSKLKKGLPKKIVKNLNERKISSSAFEDSLYNLTTPSIKNHNNNNEADELSSFFNEFTLVSQENLAMNSENSSKLNTAVHFYSDDLNDIGGPNNGFTNDYRVQNDDRYDFGGPNNERNIIFPNAFEDYCEMDVSNQQNQFELNNEQPTSTLKTLSWRSPLIMSPQEAVSSTRDCNDTSYFINPDRESSNDRNPIDFDDIYDPEQRNMHQENTDGDILMSDPNYDMSLDNTREYDFWMSPPFEEFSFEFECENENEELDEYVNSRYETTFDEDANANQVSSSNIDFKPSSSQESFMEVDNFSQTDNYALNRQDDDVTTTNCYEPMSSSNSNDPFHNYPTENDNRSETSSVSSSPNTTGVPPSLENQNNVFTASNTNFSLNFQKPSNGFLNSYNQESENCSPESTYSIDDESDIDNDRSFVLLPLRRNQNNHFFTE